MKIFYSDLFPLPLPAGHRFPMSKYSMLRQRVVESRQLQGCRLTVPEPAGAAQLQLAHCPDYVARVEGGTLATSDIRRIGFPWSSEMVIRSKRSCGATIEAARAALNDGLAVSLAGGTHHAQYDRGEGFCVFNDSAVAALTIQQEGWAERIAIVDCDVHQGNGTASILRNAPEIFTFSIHGSRNFPFHKESSDLDVALDDGTEDEPYLKALDRALDQTLENSRPDLVIYLAGADPYREDRLGRLALSKEGLAARDSMVLERCRKSGIAVAVTMAGGYAGSIGDIVDIHYATVLQAFQLFAATD